MRCPTIVPLLWCASAIALGQTARGQALTPPAAQVEAMQKLAVWVGEWKGTGWVTVGAGQRHEFTITEKVQPKIGGSILLIEGLGKRKNDNGAGDIVVHDALAVLSYDRQAKRYRWRAHDIRGQALDVEPQLIEGGLQWGFRNEQAGVSIRFTIQVDEKRWHEIGEVTRDGKTWQKFLEMNLERQKSAAAR